MCDGTTSAPRLLIHAGNFQYRIAITMPTEYTGKPVLEWFAVRTRSNRETVVAEAFAGKGFGVWCPRYKAPPLRTDAVLKPLFPGYLFSRFNVLDRLPILVVPGVV